MRYIGFIYSRFHWPNSRTPYSPTVPGIYTFPLPSNKAGVDSTQYAYLSRYSYKLPTPGSNKRRAVV